MRGERARGLDAEAGRDAGHQDALAAQVTPSSTSSVVDVAPNVFAMIVSYVIPANAGIQGNRTRGGSRIPAFAGMTESFHGELSHEKARGSHS